MKPKQQPFRPTRRQVMGGGAALLGAGFLSACGDDGALKVRDILGAEKLAGVKYTEAEREQLMQTLDDHLDRLRTLRALKQPNDLAPALTFDPRLPSKTYPGQNNDKIVAPAKAPALPASEVEIAFAPASHLAAWIRAGKISSLELTDLYLKRIEKFAPQLECFVTLTPDLARSQARAADADLAAGNIKGPLHGVPYAVKDLFDTRGIRTTWGAMPYKDRVAERDAWVVERLREKGAVLLGKATLGAIAYGDIWFSGKTRNPWNPDEGSSGSSAGSAAATAAGLCGFAIGTETLGSIVSPSNRCGTAGLRPTFGRVPRTGAMALCWSLDKIGPICRSVDDTFLVLSQINGHAPADPGSLAFGLSRGKAVIPSDLTLGFDPHWFEGEDAHPLDQKAFEALKSLGFKTKEIKIPERPYGSLLTVLLAEAAAAFEELTEDNLDDLMVWQDDAAWPNSWREARFIPAVDMVNADRLRRTVMEDMHALFKGVDLLAGPNFASSLLTITNYTGHPQLTLRAGFREVPTRTLFGEEVEGAKPHKVPRNFSLWAPLFQEGLLTRVGALLEEKLGVAGQTPGGFS